MIMQLYSKYKNFLISSIIIIEIVAIFILLFLIIHFIQKNKNPEQLKKTNTHDNNNQFNAADAKTSNNPKNQEEDFLIPSDYQENQQEDSFIPFDDQKEKDNDDFVSLNSFENVEKIPNNIYTEEYSSKKIFIFNDFQKISEFDQKIQKDFIKFIKETINLSLSISDQIKNLNNNYPKKTEEQKTFNSSENMKKFFDIIQRIAYFELKKEEIEHIISETNSIKLALSFAPTLPSILKLKNNIKNNITHCSELIKKTKFELENVYQVSFNEKSIENII
jgi:hypothetical protein